MTPAQLDHLRRIDAHLAKLLSLAEKRTPGEWRCVNSPLGGSSQQDEYDEMFVEACAGNAEAGWRAVRAAIAEILAAHEARYESWCLVCQELKQDPGSLQDYPLPPWADDILAAFPLEMLTE